MYHYADGEVSRGPVAREALRGQITPQTLVWREGLADWQPAGSLPELADLFADAPSMPPPPPPPPVPSAAAAALPETPLQPIHYQPAAPPAPTPGAAVASLVLGIVGLTTGCIGIVPAILALIFGYNARAAGAVNGRPGAGLATAGIVMGWILCGLWLLGGVLFGLAALIGSMN